MDLAGLIDQIKQGDQTAGAVLVSVLAPRLLGYADFIASDLSEPDREQVVEAAIETAIRKVDQYDESRGTFPAWVRAFVRHGAADWRRRHPGIASGDLATEPQPPTESPDQPDEIKGRLVALSAIVLAEPLPDQLLIRLRFADGLSHAQIAQRLGVTEAACRKRLERLLERLRRRAAEDPNLGGLLNGEENDRS